MSKSAVPDILTVGPEPRASLLPPEVIADRKAKSTRRSLGFGVLGVLLLVVLAIGGASLLAVQAQGQLADAQARTVTLLAQQHRYIEVRQVQDQVTLVQAAQQVGASTEIDWKDYLTKVQATLPANVTINTVNLDSATPLAVYTQSTAALQGERVATLSFNATSPTLPEVPVWLKSLATLPGFADATPGSVSLDTKTNLYSASVTLHINEAAFDGRFAPKAKEK
jgi:hypothetical protein